jgi:acyl carrier protein
MPPLRGVFHLAGVLADGILQEQDWASFRHVFEPKILGAWNLHDLTRTLPLDCFVLYSSWSSVLGSVGQANHSAANAFLDALAVHRQSAGLPGLSVNWAAWLGTGAATVGDRLTQLAGRGIGSFSAASGLDLLGRSLAGSAPQVAVMPFDLDAWRARNTGGGRRRFDLLERPGDTNPAASDERPIADLARIASGADGADRLKEFVTGQLARTLNISPERVETNASFRSLGLDSLTGLELRNRLERHSGLGLSATVVWNYPSVDRLTEHLFEVLTGDAGDRDSAEAREEEEVLAALLDEIESVSDDEARQILAGAGRNEVAE